MTIGLIGAMPQEIELIKHHMHVTKTFTIAKRAYYQGELHGKSIVLSQSRIGKVSAAVTTAMMLEHFDIDQVIFTGVAGAISPQLNVGDIIISETLFQHDMDASPLFPRYEVPLLGHAVFNADEHLCAQLFEAANTFLTTELNNEISANARQQFLKKPPTLYHGSVASGDQFIKSTNVVCDIEQAAQSLNLRAPSCVEMEGAACAQVCFAFNTPMVVVRTISDKADHSAPVDFDAFIDTVASHFSYGVIKAFLLAPLVSL